MKFSMMQCNSIPTDDEESDHNEEAPEINILMADLLTTEQIDDVEEYGSQFMLS
jgi:hypothetical protein